MEKQYRVWFEATASTSVDVTVDTGSLEPEDVRDAIEEEAYKKFQGVTVCHRCAHEFDLGDFEIPTEEYGIEGL